MVDQRLYLFINLKNTDELYVYKSQSGSKDFSDPVFLIAILNVSINAENVRKALNFWERGLGRLICTFK
jgi:hypothetical protein